MNRDPYDVLGLTRESGPAEWKRAFRRLAMQWHPDRNDHPDATERFKEITVAYEQLTVVSPDNEPTAATGDDAQNSSPVSEDNAPRAPDIRLNLELSLEDAATGCRKTISYFRGKVCSTCQGSGEAGMARTRFCPACHGSGRVRDIERVLIPCTDCGGRGLFTERICPNCAGSGRDTVEVSLEITVPAGMLPGDELRLAGQGESGDSDLPAGDLYLTVVLHSHTLYNLRGRNLHFSMPVSALAMIAGSEIELPSLTGSAIYQLEAGAAAIRQVCLAGKGYPGRGKNRAGDLVVELAPVFPSQLSARQRKMLLQANAALLENIAATLPEIVAWREANGLG